MAKIKHTPGDWKANPGPVGMIIDGGSAKIATLPSGVCHPTEDLEPNAELIALAPTAPHECDDDNCPGNRNRRKLEAFDAIVEFLRSEREGFSAPGNFVKQHKMLDAIAKAEEE